MADDQLQQSALLAALQAADEPIGSDAQLVEAF
jgi:hypothetical protein